MLWKLMIKKLLEFLFGNKDVLFVGCSDLLPPPLDREIEESLVIKSNMGDLDARNKLIEHNLRLVVFLVM